MTTYLTVTEVAKRLGLARRTVYDRIADGRITAVRHGPNSGLRVSEDALSVYLAGCQAAQQAAVARRRTPPPATAVARRRGRLVKVA